ncbi:hypothetical protein [Capillimicrobium parvum]|nr:hypothetical protein [Capillimicrobium parvum]
MSGSALADHAADRLAAELHDLDPDDALILAVLPGDPIGRQAALDYYAAVTTELRRRGWRIETGARHLPDGKTVLAISDPVPPYQEGPG